MLLILKQCEDKCTVGNMWHVENGTITSTITNLSSETNVFSDIINSDTKGDSSNTVFEPNKKTRIRLQ